MGSRGKLPNATGMQQTINDFVLRVEVAETISRSQIIREQFDKLGQAESVSGQGNIDQMYKPCACCGEYTLPFGTCYEICTVCGWIDDPNQNANPDSMEGKNRTSLSDARRQYFKRRNQSE